MQPSLTQQPPVSQPEAGHHELRRDVRTGRALQLLGGFGVVAAIVGTVLALVLVGQAGDTLKSSLGISVQAAELAESTVEAAGEGLAVAGSSLEQLELGAGNSVETFTTMSRLFRDAAGVMGDDVPDTVATIRATTPQIGESVALLTSVLEGLAFLGVDAPDLGISDSLEEVDGQLGRLSADFEEQAELLRELAEDLEGFADTAAVVEADLGRAAATLQRVDELVAGYEQASRDAAAVIDVAVARVDGQVRLARILVVVLGLVVVAAQAVPILLGRRLRHQAAGRV